MGVEGRRQAGLLVFLLINANQAVSADRLIDVLWSDQSPDGGRKRLRMAIVRLRQTLEACGGRESALRTVAGGYVLDVRAGELDADVFATCADEGHRALDRGDARQATKLLREAFSLWRGSALADVAYEEWAQPEIQRLEELRLLAHEWWIDAELQLGQHAALVGELEGLARCHPTRERFAEQLMLALYRCGRQADALDVYQRARAHLSAQLGLEPSPRLRALQADVFVQSMSLELPRESVRPMTARDERAALSGLPSRPIDMLGRDSDTRTVTGMLRRRDVRLVTVMGAGGVGKTTLAVEVAHRLAGEFAEGAVFVDLSALSDPAAVADALLHALDCTSAPGESLKDTLRRQASAQERLLVLDNLEHLLAAAPLVADVVDASPGLKLLVTSRAALDVRAERRYPLDPLALPDSSRPSSVASAPATALFVVRALARDPAFRLDADNADAIATVCARVGGLPLAIELAAARAGTLSPREIAQRLDSLLMTLGNASRDACDRHRTLRATLDWSYGLVDASQRAAFAKLSVFAGGCTIEAAQTVTGASLDMLECLIDHSMLMRSVLPDGTVRLTMLGPVREYASELLASHPDATTIFDRHSQYFTELAESTAPRLVTADQLVWQRRLDADADNLHEALAREYRAGNAERVLRLAIALREWWKRGRGSAGRAWIQKGLAASRDPPAQLRADALTTFSLLCLQQGDITPALQCASHALELYDDVCDRRGKTVALVAIAVCHLLLVDPQGAQTAASDAVQCAHDLGAWPHGYALIAQALAAPDPATASAIAHEAARYLQQAGDLRAQAWLYGDLGYKALEHGALDQAHELISRSLQLSEQLDDQVHHTFDVGHIALWALESGDDAGAAAGLSDALTRYCRYGIRRPIPEVLIALATIAANAGQATRAAELVGAATTLRAEEPLSTIEQRLHFQAINRSRHELEVHAWQHAYDAGCRCTLEQAVALGITTADHCARHNST